MSDSERDMLVVKAILPDRPSPRISRNPENRIVRVLGIYPPTIGGWISASLARSETRQDYGNRYGFEAACWLWVEHNGVKVDTDIGDYLTSGRAFSLSRGDSFADVDFIGEYNPVALVMGAQLLRYHGELPLPPRLGLRP